MNDDDRNPNTDPNPYWDYVEPECRWAPQCHRTHIPGACDRCESLNPNPNLAWYEDPESWVLAEEREPPADPPFTPPKHSIETHARRTDPVATTQETTMHQNSLTGERKLFLVPRTPTPPKPAKNHRLRNSANDALLPLTLTFLALLLVSGYLCLYGRWGRAKDFLTIFLPPITALLGVAVRSRF